MVDTEELFSNLQSLALSKRGFSPAACKPFRPGIGRDILEASSLWRFLGYFWPASTARPL
jgi:hypothetical protein